MLIQQNPCTGTTGISASYLQERGWFRSGKNRPPPAPSCCSSKPNETGRYLIRRKNWLLSPSERVTELLTTPDTGVHCGFDQAGVPCKVKPTDSARFGIVEAQAQLRQNAGMKWLLVSFLGFAMVAARGAVLTGTPLVFAGMCDASAAFALSEDLFAVASDEDNILRFYRLQQPGRPVHSYDLNPILSDRRKVAEADFEGAARLGNRVFLITSHGRTAQGKVAPTRHRLIALDCSDGTGGIIVTQVGKAYTNLVADLISEPRFSRLGLANAARLAPKSRGALNIEALTDTPERALLIGFRNPVPQGQALIVPLLNPNEVINGRQPKFGEALFLDLGGLGLRGMGSKGDGYYLIAGPADDEAECRLFVWQGGKAGPQPVEGVRFPGINPEGICFHDAKGRDDFWVLSDDGTRQFKGIDCKLLPEAERRFRAFRLSP